MNQCTTQQPKYMVRHFCEWFKKSAYSNMKKNFSRLWIKRKKNKKRKKKKYKERKKKKAKKKRRQKEKRNKKQEKRKKKQEKIKKKIDKKKKTRKNQIKKTLKSKFIYEDCFVYDESRFTGSISDFILTIPWVNNFLLSLFLWFINPGHSIKKCVTWWFPCMLQCEGSCSWDL